MVLLLALPLQCVVAQAEPREQLLGSAMAYWDLAEGGANCPQWPLAQTGAVALDQPAEGAGAREGERCARLAGGWFSAGAALHAPGRAVTVYLRAHDPAGRWMDALLAKRGTHETVHLNLFSVDLDGDGTGDIGFEAHTEIGFASVHFSTREIDPTAWHDLVGRYDGEVLELVCDGKVMARRAWPGGALTRNEEPLLIGAETDRGQTVRAFQGEVSEAALWDRALTDDELATLCRVEHLDPGPPLPTPYASPVHYRPRAGALADTIPFFWQGEYHIFYLLSGFGGTPWAHIKSRDLIHWEELPIALPLGRPEEPDGGCVFTGSVTESDGVFHIFYTGFNPQSPAGRECVMHATSPDLVQWTKQPQDTFRADGRVYDDLRGEDFRDPFVFRNEDDGLWWMLLCARDGRTRGCVTGVATSPDLTHWTQVEPLFGGTLGPQECPDLFRIGETWYLIYSPSVGTTDYAFAPALRGPWIHPEERSIDTPELYAAKSMFDGNRRVLTGWLRDLDGARDDGGMCWGGDQSTPREVYEVREGVLGFRPVAEAIAAFPEVLGSLADAKPVTRAGAWASTPEGLHATLANGNAWLQLETPDSYMLQCTVTPEPGAVLSLGLREGEQAGSGYQLRLDPATGAAELRSGGYRYGRHLELTPGEPIALTILVQGTLIECFVNDRFVLSGRAYDIPSGRFGLTTEGAPATLAKWELRTHE